MLEKTVWVTRYPDKILSWESRSPSVMVQRSIEMLLADDGFKVPSPRATEAVKCGSALLNWCSQDAREKSLDHFQTG